MRPFHHDDNDEEMLRSAIAMSLEEQEEKPSFGTGWNLKMDIAENLIVLKIRLQKG